MPPISKSRRKKPVSPTGVTPKQARAIRARVAAQIEALFLADRLGRTADEIFQAVMIALLPEEFAPPAASPAASTTAPGGRGRVAVMRQRLAAGQALFVAADADPVRNDRLALAGRVQRNGGDVKAKLWSPQATQAEVGPVVQGWAVPIAEEERE